MKKLVVELTGNNVFLLMVNNKWEWTCPRRWDQTGLIAGTYSLVWLMKWLYNFRVIYIKWARTISLHIRRKSDIPVLETMMALLIYVSGGTGTPYEWSVSGVDFADSGLQGQQDQTGHLGVYQLIYLTLHYYSESIYNFNTWFIWSSTRQQNRYLVLRR